MRRFIQISRASYKIFFLFKNESKNGTVNYAKIGSSLNKIIDDLGPTFIKLGQMLSLRPDIIPPDLADELRKLLDHGNLIESPEIVQLFKSEIGKNPLEVFDSFESAPFAVASLAQVHRAMYQGKELAIKVQKPGIYDVISKDLRLVKGITRLILIHPKLKKLKPMADIAVDEFFNWIHRELDYRLEAMNIERISKNFEDVKYFKAPKVYHEISTKKILAMEYINGVSLNELFDNFPDLSERKVVEYKGIVFDRKKFLDHALEIIFKQIFEDGIFHADPHPGNILITKENVIVLIDFGIIGILQPRIKDVLVEIFMGIIDRDIEKISQAFINLDEIEGHASLYEIENQVRNLLNEWQTGSIMEMTTVQLFFELIKISLAAKIELPFSIVIIGKTLLELDGDLRKVDPGTDLIASFRKLAEEKHGIDLIGFSKKITENPIEGFKKLVESLPLGIQSAVNSLSDKGVDFSFEFGPSIISKKPIKGRITFKR